MATLKQMIAEVRRELFLRQEVYPGLISGGKMTNQDAKKHTERMQAVLEFLKAQISKQGNLFEEEVE